MKVCMIYDFLSEFGGLEREIVNHSLMLRQKGHEVEVLTCHYDKDTLKKMAFRDIKVTNISMFKTKYELVNIILCMLGFNNLGKINPDLFVSYSFPSNFLIRNKKTKRVNYINHFPHFLYLDKKEKMEWASSTKGIKRMFTTVVTWFLQDYLKRLDNRLVWKNNLNFANSDFTKKRLDKLYGTNMTTSYPPVDSIFAPSKKKMKDKFIYSSSRIIPDKKYEWLIEACAMMKNKLPIYISGQGNENYMKKLQNFAERKKVKLKFVGRLSSEELVMHYTNAMVFAFPTPGEDFGLVPAESLACGTPVVIWGDGAGPTEQVIDGTNGFHAKPYDIKDFAAKMDKVIESGMKKKNRKKIIKSAEKFTYDYIKDDFVKIIEDKLFKSS